jgi:DNA-binding transcriptional LysR family regulator
MNIERLSLDQMRVALTVADTGSFSSAARVLNRKQSAISYAVTTLEGQLGLALFDRSDGQPPTPTSVGKVLLREMEAVVRSADEIRKKAQAAASGLETEVTIALDSLYSAAELSEVLKGFSDEFPTVRLSIEVEAMGAVQQSVLEAKCILGVAGSYPHLPAGLVGDAITQVARVPVASPRHPLGVGDRELPSRALLDQIQIVLTDRSQVTAGRDFSVYTGKTWRVSEQMIKRDLLLAGFGWGYMPEHLIAADVAAGRLRVLQVEGLRNPNTVALLLIRRRDRLLGPAAQWLLSRFLHQSDSGGPRSRESAGSR